MPLRFPKSTIPSACAGLALLTVAFSQASAATIILANRTPAAVRCIVRDRDAADKQEPGKKESNLLAAEAPLPTIGLKSLERRPPRQPTGAGRYTIEAGEQLVLRVAPSAAMEVAVDRGSSYSLETNAVYYFAEAPDPKVKGPQLHQIGLNAEDLLKRAAALERAPPKNASLQPKRTPEQIDAARTITVAIYADDEEAATRAVWENRLKKRIEAASKILDQHCGIRLEVVETGEWESDDKLNDFDRSLREFESRVRPRKARLAIGFTSQYQLTRGRTHLGGTRGPLSSHILLREWSLHISESERLELLLHELAHFLGAAHSPESDTAMRPVLGDRQARSRRFRIGLDPVNTLAVNLVSEEIAERGVRSFAELTPPTKLRLAAVYKELQRAMPDDSAAAEMLRILLRIR